MVAALRHERNRVAQPGNQRLGPHTGRNDDDIVVVPFAASLDGGVVALRGQYSVDARAPQRTALALEILCQPGDEAVRVEGMRSRRHEHAFGEPRRERRLQVAKAAGIEHLDPVARRPLQRDGEAVAGALLPNRVDIEHAPPLDQRVEAGFVQQRHEQIESRAIERGQRRRDRAHPVFAARTQEGNEPGHKARELAPVEIERAGFIEQPAGHLPDETRHRHGHHGSWRQHTGVAEGGAGARGIAVVERDLVALASQETRGDGSDDAGTDDRDGSCCHETPCQERP